MKDRIIKKNRRRPFPSFEFLPIFVKRNRSYFMSKFVVFTNSAIYHFDDENQYDVNKLFGFSFGWHHINSVRFGWRPNDDLTKIEIVGYEYINKVRVPTIPICDVELNKVYRYELKYNGALNQIEYCVFDVDNQYCTVHPITLRKKHNWGYQLGLYFGGNKKAPHDICLIY